MARRRLQQQGDLYKQGGWWKLRYRVDVIASNGSVKRGWSPVITIGPSEGNGAFTEKEARRISWDNYLSRLDQNNRTPASIATLEQFVQQKFIPSHVRQLKPSGKKHYENMLKLILPVLGELRLRDVKKDHLQQLINIRQEEGYSWQTTKHIKNVLSAIFTFAAEEEYHTGVNPAKLVKIGEKVTKATHALTAEQLIQVLDGLTTPYKEMVLTSVMTSMNVAEICGLRWGRMNLTDSWGTSDGEALPPWTMLICEQWYRGKFGSVKATSRRRLLPIPHVLRERLSNLRVRGHHIGPDDVVFASKSGTPLDEHNIAKRHLKPLGIALEMPWLSWHVFRRTHTTLSKEAGMSAMDRMASMGHADYRMTLLYSKESLDSRLVDLDKMGAKITIQ